MGVVARRDDVAHVHVDVVVGVHLDAALRLVLLQLLAAVLLQLLLVGVAVVVEGGYLVDPEQGLSVRDVARLVRVEVHDGALLKLARARTDQVVDAAVDAREREVEQIGIDLVRIVHHGRQGQLDLAALAAHRDLSAVGLRERPEAAVAVAEAVKGEADRRAVGRGREEVGQPHAGDERREHLARLPVDAEAGAAVVWKQALARQDAVPGAALARDGARRVAPRLVACLVHHAAVLRVVNENELTLFGSVCRVAFELEGVLVAAEREVEREVRELAHVAQLLIVHD